MKKNFIFFIILLCNSTILYSQQQNEILTKISSELILQKASIQTLDNRTDEQNIDITTLDNRVEILESTTEEQTADINILDTRADAHDISITRVDTVAKLSSGIDYQVDTIKNLIKSVYGHWNFVDSAIRTVRQIAYRYTRSDEDTEPIWTAVGYNTLDGIILTSMDGLSWDTTATTYINRRIYDVTMEVRQNTGGFRWAAVGQKAKVTISTDGVSWFSISDIDASTGPAIQNIFGAENTIHGVGFGDDGDPLWVFVGYEGKVGSSRDLTGGTHGWLAGTWANTPPRSTQDFYRVTWEFDADTNTSLWIAVGTEKLFATSTDGKI